MPNWMSHTLFKYYVDSLEEMKNNNAAAEAVAKQEAMEEIEDVIS